MLDGFEIAINPKATQTSQIYKKPVIPKGKT